MQRPATKPVLEFEGGFGEREAFEAKGRGYRSHVHAVLPTGERYAIVFYDPVRLQQDLEEEAKAGSPHIADPGMIVVPEITLENMHDAVERLVEDGYFDSLRPMSR